jgi:hypothetical protein
MHAAELPAISVVARVLCVLERAPHVSAPAPSPADEQKVRAGMRR